MEAFAQDRQGTLRADGRDSNVEQASYSYSGSGSCDGRAEILPTLLIGEKEVDMFVNGLDGGFAGWRKFSGPMWERGNNFVCRVIWSARASEAHLGVSAAG